MIDIAAVLHSYLNLHGFADDLLAICAALDICHTSAHPPQ